MLDFFFFLNSINKWVGRSGGYSTKIIKFVDHSKPQKKEKKKYPYSSITDLAGGGSGRAGQVSRVFAHSYFQHLMGLTNASPDV